VYKCHTRKRKDKKLKQETWTKKDWWLREREDENKKMSEGHVIRIKKSLVICSQREECVRWRRELNGGKNTMKIMNVKAILEKEKYKKFPK